MNILVSIVISALMVLGSMAWTSEHKTQPLGASQTISSLTNLVSPNDNDMMPIVDSITSTTKKITVANLYNFIVTNANSLYSPIFSTSAGLAGLLSDETGSGGGFVRATSPTLTSATLTSATMTTPYINVSGTEAAGDMLYLSDSGGTLSRLGIGSNGNLLTVSGGLPAWSSTNSNFTWGGTMTFNATTTANAPVFGFGTFTTVLASTTITGNTTPQPVYIATTTNALLLSDANDNPASQFIGFAVSSASNGASTTVQVSGVVRGFSGLTPGALYYVQDAVGTIGTTVGTNDILVGQAISSTELLLRKNEKWEFVGSGTGATVVVNPIANHFVVNANVTSLCGASPSKTSYAQMTLSRIGVTSSTVSFAGFCNAASSEDIVLTASLSGNTVTISGSGGDTPSYSGTVYSYR